MEVVHGDHKHSNSLPEHGQVTTKPIIIGNY